MQTESSELDVQRYIRLVFKRRLVFAITAMAITATFIIASYVLPKKYEAKSTVLVESNVINNLVEGIAVTPSMDDRLRNLAVSMKSRNLLLKVIQNLGMDISGKNEAVIEKMVEEFQKKTQIETSTQRSRDRMDMFTVSYTHKDPQFAAEYVNTLVGRFIEENLTGKREEAYGANRFLSEQMSYFKNKLDVIDGEIVNFRKEKGVFVSIDEKSVVDEIKASEGKLEELSMGKKELKAKMSSAEKQLKNESPYTVAIRGTGNTYGNRLVALQSRLNELLINYTENYPEVLRVKAEIESLKEILKHRPPDSQQASADIDTEMSMLNPMYQQIKEELAKTEMELATAATREDHLKKLIETKKAYLRNIPGEKKKLEDLERERNTYKKIYDDLVFRLGQSEVSKQMEIQDKAETFRIVDPAVVPSKPISPNRIKLILFGIVAGIGGSFGFVLFLNSADRSVKSVDIVKELGLPVLAIIPAIQTDEELARKRKKDTILYVVTGAYTVCITGILFFELMGSRILK